MTTGKNNNKNGDLAKVLVPTATGIVGLATGVGVANADAALEIAKTGGPAVAGALIGFAALVIIDKSRTKAFELAFRAMSEGRDRSEKNHNDALDSLRKSLASDSKALNETMGGVREGLAGVYALLKFLAGQAGHKGGPAPGQRGNQDEQ